jgi:hypothetical protein
MSYSFLEEGWGFAASRHGIRPKLEMQPVGRWRGVEPVEHALTIMQNCQVDFPKMDERLSAHRVERGGRVVAMLILLG